MSWFRQWGLVLFIGFSVAAVYSGGVLAEERGDTPRGSQEAARISVTDVEGVSVHATEEEPRVLYIVPWQAPTIPNRERENVKLTGAEQILEPIDIETFRTHRQFRKTLDILSVDRSGP